MTEIENPRYPGEVTVSPARSRPGLDSSVIVDRPRVTRRILSLPPAEVLIVCATRGYGSSTAVAAAMEHSGDLVYWVTVDATTSDDECREALHAALQSPVDSGTDGVLSALEQSPPAWLVIDGLSSCHREFGRDLLVVAAHIPPQLRMVVVSTAWFGLLPGAQRLTEEELAFTDDEAVELLTKREAAFDIDTVNEVIDLCQGWASALVVASGHPQGAAEWLRSAGSISLFGRWYAGLPTDQQQFLQGTRVLSALCAANTAAVTGDPFTGQILMALDADRAHLREIDPPIPDTGRWWRRHPLLSAYLDHISDEVSALAEHSRAADWYMTTEDVESAMHHLLAAGRQKEAGQYLFDNEAGLLSRGRNADKIVSWYEQVHGSDEDLFRHLLRIGWGQALTQDIDGAQDSIGRIHRELADQQRRERCPQGPGVDLQPPGSAQSAVAAEAALLKAYLACFQADPQAVVMNARRLAMEPPAHVNAESAQLAPILIGRGLTWSGQPEAAARVLDAAAAKPLPNDVMRETHLAVARALCDVSNGYVRRARTRIEAATRWMQHAGFHHDTLLFGPSLIVSAEVTLEFGDTDNALILAHQGLEDAERTNVLAEVAWAHVVVARCHLAAGDFGAALRALSEARSCATQCVPDSSLAVVVDHDRAVVHLAARDLGQAVRIIKNLPPSDARSLLWARAGLEQQPAVARRTLENIQSVTPRIEAQRHALLAAIQARASRRMAQGHLRKAAAISHSNGLGQSLNHASPALMNLAESTALEHQDDNLLWLLRSGASLRRPRRTAGPHTSLSRGELELLVVLPTRAKNADIADDLGVSINTVKTRLRRLYAKLGANNRDEAIEIARQRGLLE